jgi:hypothetical protein
LHEGRRLDGLAVRVADRVRDHGGVETALREREPRHRHQREEVRVAVRVALRPEVDQERAPGPTAGRVGIDVDEEDRRVRLARSLWARRQACRIEVAIELQEDAGGDPEPGALLDRRAVLVDEWICWEREARDRDRAVRISSQLVGKRDIVEGRAGGIEDRLHGPGGGRQKQHGQCSGETGKSHSLSS